jgi:hypothetical protein
MAQVTPIISFRPGYQKSELELVSEYLPMSIKIMLCGVQSFFPPYTSSHFAMME